MQEYSNELDANSLRQWVDEAGISKKIKSIVIDLTPVLPGGENGGAKVCLLELIQKLSSSSPQTKFTLLTKYLSHQELEFLDAKNVQRLLVINESGPLDSNCIIRSIPNLPDDSLFERCIYRYQDFYNRCVTLAIKIFQYPSKKFSDESIFKKIVHHLTRYTDLNLRIRPKMTLLKKLKADIFLSPFTAIPFYDSSVATVCIIHDLQHKSYPNFFDASEIRNRDYIFNEACIKASIISAVSNYSERIAKLHGNLNASQIRTTYWRMSERVMYRPQMSAKNLICLETQKLTKKRYLIYPANFWAHKNHEMLITAFGIAISQGLPDDIKLVCTGAPSSRRDVVMNLVLGLGLDDRIIFPGYVSNEELSIFMSNSMGMIFPSLYEGFGLPVVEAMANGIPVACSNATSLPEITNGAAILFNPKIPTQIADAIKELASQNEKLNKLIKVGKSRAQYFSNTYQMTKEYWEIFDMAIKNKKTPRIFKKLKA